MEVTLTPRRAALALAGVALLLAAVGTVGYLGQYAAGQDTAPGRFFAALRQLFRLNAEGNASSWFATALLLGCAALLAGIAAGTAAARLPFTRHWWGLAAIFVFLSLDEAISIHEAFDGWIQAVIDTRGVFVYVWVVPYGAIALAVAITYVKFLAHLPRTIANRFVLAGALYVGGAAGFETLQGHLAVFRGEGHLALAALAATVAVEEILEMLGAVLFIYGRRTYLAAQGAEVRFRAIPHHSPGQATATSSAGQHGAPAPDPRPVARKVGA